MKLIQPLVTSCLLAFVMACSEPPDSPDTPDAVDASTHLLEKGHFKDSKQWRGMETGQCGARLMVVAVDGSAEEYWPPKGLLDQFTYQAIKQNDSERPAVILSDVMARFGADRVRLTSCSGPEIVLGDQDLAKWPGLLVLSGRGPLKVVKEQDDGYVTVLRMLRKMEFLRGHQAVVTADVTEMADAADNAQPAN